MPDLDLLTKLLAMFSDGPPAVNDNLCLNRRYKAANCQLCAAACPVAAITVYGPNIDLNEDICTQCGLCLNVCPTGVFSTSQQLRHDKRLLDSAAPHRAQRLELTCPANPKPERTAAPVDGGLQTGRGLAAVSLGEVRDLGQMRDVDLWLNDSGCASCPLGRVLPAIHTTVAETNRILAAWQGAPRLHLQTTSAQDCVPVHPVERVADQQPVYSRREFFTFLRRSAAQVVSDIALDALAPAAPDLSVVPPIDRAVIPLHRRRLVAALNRLGPPPPTPLSLEHLPWADVSISTQCTGCSLCARFCPTGAIRWTEGDVTAAPGGNETAAGPVPRPFALHFIAADCVDCGICATACPEGAVALHDVIEPARLVQRQSVALHAGSLAPCIRCGTFTDTQVRETCYVCQRATAGPPAQE